jgi:hypothetical protein
LESRISQRLLIVESFGVDGRHHSNEDEESKIDFYDFGGHPFPSFFLKDDLVNLDSLKLNENALVTCSRFFLSFPFSFVAPAVAGEPGGVS